MYIKRSLISAWCFGKDGPSLFTHHSNSVRSQQLLGTHGSDVSNVCKNVHKSHKRYGDKDSTREVSVRRDKREM